MKKPLLFFGALSVLTLAFAIAGCGNKKSVAVQSGDGGTGPGGQTLKPIYDTPPHYSETQFKVGQWIQWKKTSTTGQKACERWTVTAVNMSTVQIEGLHSKDCENWFPDQIEFLVFRIGTGNIEIHEIDVGVGKPRPGFRTSIYDRWYGATKKVEHVIAHSTIGKNKFPSFQMKGESEEFFHLPGHSFHAVALEFFEEEENLKWRFQYDTSNPVISPETEEINPNALLTF